MNSSSTASSRLSEGNGAVGPGSVNGRAAAANGHTGSLAEVGSLVEAERWARYCWAAQAVLGREVLDAGCGLGYGIEILAAAGAKRVVGVDTDAGAVVAASGNGTSADAVLEADLEDLPLPEDCFDVILCLQALPADRVERVLDELRRVLRPDGLLLLCAELVPGAGRSGRRQGAAGRVADIAAVVGEQFANTATYQQEPWRARSDAAGDGGHDLERVAALVAASDGALPPFADRVTLGGVFSAKRRSKAAPRSAAENGHRPDDGRARAVEHEFVRAIAQASAREVELRERLGETSTALLEASRQLAELPLIKHRLAELHREHAHLWDRYNEIEWSRSWRMTAPLRRLRGALRVR